MPPMVDPHAPHDAVPLSTFDGTTGSLVVTCATCGAPWPCPAAADPSAASDTSSDPSGAPGPSTGPTGDPDGYPPA